MVFSIKYRELSQERQLLVINGSLSADHQNTMLPKMVLMTLENYLGGL